MKDLWPQKIELSDERVTPVSILKEQASLLGEKTRNLVKAYVNLRVSRKRNQEIDDIIYYDFNIIAPLLDNYMFRLFTTVHNITKIYPIRIILEEQLSQELYGTGNEEAKSIMIVDEDHFMSELIKILGSETVKNIIRTFSSQTPEKTKKQ